MVERATGYFSNRFPISPGCSMSRDEIERRVQEYFWHYPFSFDDLHVRAQLLHFKGLEGRHYQRYCHFFPELLSLCGGSLAGRSLFEFGCNAGFWTIQARLAGAERVVGVDLSEKNIEQAEFVLDVIGLDAIEYRTLNVYDVTREDVGEFDLTFFLGVLYHIDKPIEALERLYEVTGEIAVVDTTLARSDIPDGVAALKLQEDRVHAQNFSNRLAMAPSASAVPVMLRHVGFRDVFWVQNTSKNLPLDYTTRARMTFIARK
jgi:2-polyprenyl-3-methyl-5-hydroxy-6-metoxy-1,4-benzoquinol methylase